MQVRRGDSFSQCFSRFLPPGKPGAPPVRTGSLTLTSVDGPRMRGAHLETFPDALALRSLPACLLAGGSAIRARTQMRCICLLKSDRSRGAGLAGGLDRL